MGRQVKIQIVLMEPNTLGELFGVFCGGVGVGIGERGAGGVCVVRKLVCSDTRSWMLDAGFLDTGSWILVTEFKGSGEAGWSRDQE